MASGLPREQSQDTNGNLLYYMTFYSTANQYTTNTSLNTRTHTDDTFKSAVSAEKSTLQHHFVQTHPKSVLIVFVQHNTSHRTDHTLIIKCT